MSNLLTHLRAGGVRRKEASATILPRGVARSIRKWLALGALSIALANGVDAADWALTGDLTTHDPSIIKEGTEWWCFSTGTGGSIKYSPDGLAWTQGVQLFAAEDPWWRTYAPSMGTLDVWAPDVQAFNGRIWVYYCVSEFGQNASAIGLKSCTSIAAGDWRDDGLVIGSKPGVDAFNAIDPTLTINASGNPWLAFGSYFDGIHVVKLDPSTMKPTGQIYSIANRANGIEAANIVFENGYYYLFVSIDKCCLGVNSTYKIAYGRSTAITGPYLDKTGTAMLAGGCTVLDAGSTRWKGPGGQDVYQNGNAWVIARHAYDANNNGTPTLLISDLYWDSTGWPTYTLSPPVIVHSPLSTTASSGSSLALTVAPRDEPGLSYQWKKDGTALSGATAASLSISSLQTTDAGKYTVDVTNAAGVTTSAAATVTVATPTLGRLANLSIRTQTGVGEQTLIAGFVISGSVSKPVMIRGSGPTLVNFGLPVLTLLPNPTLNLFRDQAVIDTNANWGDSPNLASIKAINGDLMGTFALDPKEAIIYDSIAPRAYTAQIADETGAQGVALLEVFDADSAQAGTPEFAAEAKLVNVSARAEVGTGGAILIAGFIINGNVPKRVMIRGLGPSLSSSGVVAFLADPTLSVFDAAPPSNLVAQNDNWGDSGNVSDIVSVGGNIYNALPLDIHDSVLVLTLPPGGYTAQLSGVGGGTGVGLLEVYELP